MQISKMTVQPVFDTRYRSLHRIQNPTASISIPSIYNIFIGIESKALVQTHSLQKGKQSFHRYGLVFIHSWYKGLINFH